MTMTDAAQKENIANYFQQIWNNQKDSLTRLLYEFGWGDGDRNKDERLRVGNNRKEVYAYPLASSGLEGLFSQLFIKPSPLGKTLLLRFTLKTPELRATVHKRLVAGGIETAPPKFAKDSSGRHYLEYAAPLGEIIDDCAAAGEQVTGIISRFLDALRAAPSGTVTAQ